MEINYLNILFSLILYLIDESKRNMVQSCPEGLRVVCPQKCSLISGELDLDCSPGNDLRELIKQLRSANLPIKMLKVNNNPKFVELPDKIFKHLKIKGLDLSKNGLTDISPKAFMEQEDALTDLNLSSNKLTKLPDVASLKALENFDISGNKLTGGEIKPDVFAHNPKLKLVKIYPNKVLFLQQDSLGPAAASPLNTVPKAPQLVAPNLQASPPNVLKAIASPVNELVGASLLSDLLRNLPTLLTTLSALKPFQLPVTAAANGALPTNPAIASIPPNLDSIMKQIVALLTNPNAPVPPFDTLPVDIVNKVLNGGLIPGLNADQTETIKKRFMEHLVGAQNPAANVSTTKVSATTQAPVADVTTNTAKISDKSGNVNPSDDKIQKSSNLTKIWNNDKNRGIDLDEANKKTNIDDGFGHAAAAVSDRNVMLYTVLGLAIVILLTTALVVYFCCKLKQKKRNMKIRDIEEPDISASNRALYLGTSPAITGASSLKKNPYIINMTSKTVPAPTTINDQLSFGTLSDSLSTVVRHAHGDRQPSFLTLGTPPRHSTILQPISQSSPKKEDSTRDLNIGSSSEGAPALPRKWTMAGSRLTTKQNQF